MNKKDLRNWYMYKVIRYLDASQLNVSSVECFQYSTKMTKLGFKARNGEEAIKAREENSRGNSYANTSVLYRTSR